MIHQLNPTIDVSTPLGDATAIMIIDYSLDCNTVWMCRMPGGEPKHFYSDQIRIYDNPMNGKGFDVDKNWFEKLDRKFKGQADKEFNKQAGDDIVHKIPVNAKRNTDFLKKEWPIYYAVSDRTTTLLDKKIGSFYDVIKYLRNNIKSEKPYHNRVYEFHTGSLGLIFINEFILESFPYSDFGTTEGNRLNTVTQQTACVFYIEPFGKIEVKYDKKLDETFLGNRKYSGLPLSSATLKLMEGDKELITFYAEVK